MHIEQRPPKPAPQKKPLISEIKSNLTRINSSDTKLITPDFNLLKVDEPKEYYASEIDLKNVGWNRLLPRFVPGSVYD